MSDHDDKPAPPPRDWRHGGPLPEEPPHLRQRKLSEDPEVRALVAELSVGLRPGEDPLFHVPSEPPPGPALPSDAQEYVGPTEPPQAHHMTMEMARVKVRRSALPAEMARETVVLPRRGESRARRGRGAAIGIAVVAVVAGVAVATLRRPEARRVAAARATAEVVPSAASAVATASGTTSASSAATCPPECAGSASAPSTSVSASAAPIVRATATPVRATADASDPYGDAAVPSIAPTAQPAPTAIPKASSAPTAPDNDTEVFNRPKSKGQ